MSYKQPSTKLLPALLGVLLLAFTSQASLIGVHNVDSTAGDTLSSYTVDGTIPYSVLVVSVGAENPSANVSAVDFGAQPLTLIDDVNLSNGYGGLWYLVNPTLDTAANIVLTEDSGAPQNRMNITALTLSNVNQTDPIGDFDNEGHNDGGTDPLDVSLTLQGRQSLVVSTVMSGNGINDYVIDTNGDLETLHDTILSGAGGEGLYTASGGGGNVGSTFNASWDRLTSPPRVAIIAAEFQAIPEPAIVVLLLAGAGLVFHRARAR